jgi:hypothetical protein
LTETLTTSTLAPTQSPIGTFTPQPLPYPTSYGPDEFPEGFNPLGGVLIHAICLRILHYRRRHAACRRDLWRVPRT